LRKEIEELNKKFVKEKYNFETKKMV